MPAPLAKGLIIAASILVAAGIAIYESPEVRRWVDQSRRKIAVALHSLGDEIQPRRNSESSEDYDERKRKRDEIIRRNRNELVRKAREEGIAVDLDELSRIGESVGREEVEAAQRRHAQRKEMGKARLSRASTSSFDDLVGADGMLKNTGTESKDNGLRKRGVMGFGAGAASAAAANPFTDDAQVVFDHDEDEAPEPTPFPYVEPQLQSQTAGQIQSRESSATVEANTPPPTIPSPTAQLIDLTPEAFSAAHEPENPQTASIPQSEAGENDAAAQSFYSFTSSPSASQQLSARPQVPALSLDADDEAEELSTGTLTPRSEHSAFTGISAASAVGSHADDIAVLSMDDHDDNRSEVFSETGFTDAAYSEIGESEAGDRTGVLTPNSWTDVGSDDESEWGGNAAQGHVSQVHP